MKSVHLLPALSVMIGCAVLLVPASAVGNEQDALEEEFELLEEEIGVDEVESTSKHRQSIFWSPSAVTVITREEIRSSGANTIADLLRRVPGFDVYEMNPSFPLIGARALTDDSSNLVLVIVDGREAMIELTGFTIVAGLSIDPSEIERIEVIRGPGSTLYGSNAFAGIVSITTVSDRPAETIDALLSFGEEGQKRLHASLRRMHQLGGGALSYEFGLGGEGKRSQADRRHDIFGGDIRLHGYLRYAIPDGLDVSLHTGLGKGWGVLPIAMIEFPCRPYWTHFVMAKAKVDIGDRSRVSAQIFHQRSAGNFSHRTGMYAYGVWIADGPEVKMDINTVDAQVQYDFQVVEELLLIAGGNLRFSHMASDHAIPKDFLETRGALFAHAQWSVLGSLMLTGGFRVDLNSQTEEALSPRAVVVYRPVEDHSIRFGYALAFRKPSLMEKNLHIEIYDYNPAFPEIPDAMAELVGNENVTNERVHSVEAGWRGHFLDDRFQVTADLFLNVYQNTIVFNTELVVRMGMPDLLRSKAKFENDGGELYAVGGELGLSWNPAENWALWGNVGIRQVADLESNEQVVSEPRARINLGARWDGGDGPLFDLALHYVTSYEMPYKDPTNPFDPPEFMPLGNRLLLIGRAGYRVDLPGDRNLEGGLTIRAPLGENFREYAGKPVPPDLATEAQFDFRGQVLVRMVSFYLRGTF